MRLTELVTPLKPLEAMAMGKPVLASDVGGLKEMVSHEVNGLLFPAESSDAFVEAGARLGNDPGFVASLGQRARASVLEERTWPQIVSRYLPAYAAVR